MSALGIWALPPGGAEERRGSQATDQDGVLAELLVGPEYRRFLYYDLKRLTGDDVPRAGRGPAGQQPPPQLTG
jgi:hypothetical protein